MDNKKYIEKEFRVFRKYTSVYEEPIESSQENNGHTEEELRLIKVQVLDTVFRYMKEYAAMEIVRENDKGRIRYQVETYFREKDE